MIVPTITSLFLFALLVAAARKWELKPRHYLPWSLLMAACGWGLNYGLSLLLPGVPSFVFGLPIVLVAVVASIGAIMFFFFRDPERTPPKKEELIMSPADGTVVYIKEVEDAKFPFAVKNNNRIPLSEFTREELIPDRGIQIGIAMNYLNVHVNRSPIRGAVKMVQAVPGKFASLKHVQSLLENERALLVFENENLKVGIVQIASRLVRRIVSYVEEGQEVEQGQRVGMIKFGSQVDVLLSHRDDLEIEVEVGQEVTAGETILMRCTNLAQGQRKEEATQGADEPARQDAVLQA